MLEDPNNLLHHIIPPICVVAWYHYTARFPSLLLHISTYFMLTAADRGATNQRDRRLLHGAVLDHIAETSIITHNSLRHFSHMLFTKPIVNLKKASAVTLVAFTYFY